MGDQYNNFGSTDILVVCIRKFHLNYRRESRRVLFLRNNDLTCIK